MSAEEYEVVEDGCRRAQEVVECEWDNIEWYWKALLSPTPEYDARSFAIPEAVDATPFQRPLVIDNQMASSQD